MGESEWNSVFRCQAECDRYESHIVPEECEAESITSTEEAGEVRFLNSAFVLKFASNYRDWVTSSGVTFCI